MSEEPLSLIYSIDGSTSCLFVNGKTMSLSNISGDHKRRHPLPAIIGSAEQSPAVNMRSEGLSMATRVGAHVSLVLTAELCVDYSWVSDVPHSFLCPIISSRDPRWVDSGLGLEHMALWGAERRLMQGIRHGPLWPSPSRCAEELLRRETKRNFVFSPASPPLGRNGAASMTTPSSDSRAEASRGKPILMWK